jgi:peroxiredoxin
MFTRSVIAMLAAMGLTCAANAEVPTDPAKVVPVAVGALAPVFTAQEVDGRTFRFDPTQRRQPAMVIFFRGGWCPYCNAHLQDLQSVEPKLRAMGYEVLFLSTDRPEILYSSLKVKVDYHLLSDTGMNAARAFGVAFRLADETVQAMKSRGTDLEQTQGTSNHELPVPSVFIVDRSGVVRYRHFNPDYKVRLNGAEVLAAATAALGQ